MDNKYLPLGTVVSLNNNDNKIMVVGYYSVEYQNVVKIFDYSGCIYPEGLLVKNSIISFNHSDIKNVEFLGYVDDSFKVLNNNLNAQQNEPKEDMTTNDVFVNVKFDENGVVVYDEISDVKKVPEIVKSEDRVVNPFVANTPVVESVKTSGPAVNNNFKIDENGIIIEDNTVKEDLKKIESNFKFTFDENGVIVGEESLEEKKNEQPVSDVQYKFSSDGFIVDEIPLEMPKEKTEEEKEKKPVYQFDANGFIIGEQ